MSDRIASVQVLKSRHGHRKPADVEFWMAGAVGVLGVCCLCGDVFGLCMGI